MQFRNDLTLAENKTEDFNFNNKIEKKPKSKESRFVSNETNENVTDLLVDGLNKSIISNNDADSNTIIDSEMLYTEQQPAIVDINYTNNIYNGNEHNISGGDLDSFSSRLSWLASMLLFQSVCGTIMERYNSSIENHPIVLYFLTMMVGAGGNAGSQSSVIVIRGLATKKMSMRERRYIILKQFKVGLGLSICLGAVSFLRIYFFETKGLECFAISITVSVIVLTSIIIGTLLPFALLLCRCDAAHAGAAIQVIMDLGGVLLTCGISYIILGETKKKHIL